MTLLSESFIMGDWAYRIDRAETWMRREAAAEFWRARDRVRADSLELWSRL